MINDSAERKVAIRNLKIMEEALQALSDQVEASNPKLFEVVSQAYLRRIALLREEIAQYPAAEKVAVPPNG